MAAIADSPYSNALIFPEISCHQLLLNKAEEEPDRVALINAASGQHLTYGQLVTSVLRVSGALCRLGVKKGNVVCVCAPNLPETVVAMLAVMRAGGIVSGMNPTFTTSEMTTQLQDARALFMITIPEVIPKTEKVKTKYPHLQKIVVIGEVQGYTSYSELLSMASSSDVTPTVGPDDVAVLPYSSGTTGKPKGVMLTHRNLASVTQMLNHPDVAIFGRRQRTISVFPLYHVGGFIINMTNALYALSSIIYLPRYSFTLYLQAMAKYKVQLTSVPPTILLLLCKSPEVSSYDLSHLRNVAVGGSSISKHLAQEVCRRYGVQLRQCYGLTETSCLTHVTPRGSMDMATAGPPLPNVQCKVIDLTDGSTVKYGEEGEVLVRGPNIMSGYLNRPDATAETLTHDGWFHTGDIGYMREDGLLYIVDRLKELIKYNSYQVAPAELESVVLSHPAVADVAVIGVPDLQAGELPRAYVVLKQGQTPSPTDIIHYVKGRVAPYKQLRGGVVFVKAIPKTATGKILRRKIRDQVRKEVKEKSRL